MKCSENSIKKEVCPEMELLNQACLDLVGQIEELKRENAWLKEQVKESSGGFKSSEWDSSQ